MTDQNTEQDKSQDQDQELEPPCDDNVDESSPKTTDSVTPQEIRADPQQEVDELQERLLRVTADYQNYVRRSQQNITTSLEQQLLGFAKDLVTVLDHFDRAVEIDPQASSTQDLLAGVTMVRDELMRALGRYGIERIDAKKGEPFDPVHHEAMMRQPADDVESDHIVAQFHPGYTLKDKTVRPAAVSVAE